MEIVISIFAGVLLISVFASSIQEYYKFHFEWILDVDLNKVLIVWYNKHNNDGVVTREHKIIYDTGRN